MARLLSPLDQALRAAGANLDLVATALGGRRPGKQLMPHPRGWYVYVLEGHEDEILYVGQSRNLYGRLGDHMRSEEKFMTVSRIEVISCRDQSEMDRVERALISHLAPPWNQVLYKS